MTLIDAVAARLKAEVEALQERVEAAADLAELVRRGTLPQRMPAAYVLPLGDRPGAADVAVGMFRQALEVTIGVVLFAGAAGDAKGAKAAGAIDELRLSTIHALAGWAPDGSRRPLVYRRGALISLIAGTVIWQCDFAHDEQLRIS